MKQKEVLLSYDEIGNSLASLIPEVSFTIFNEPEFRQMVDFDALSQTEQDRMFNEIEVSLLGLFVLFLDHLSEETKEFADLASAEKMNDALIRGFLSIYEMLGVGAQFVKMWETLITLRLKEYREDYQSFLKEGANIKEFVEDKENMLSRWARTETITLDCVHHIRRGKIAQKDKLVTFMRMWVISVESKFAKGLTQAIFKPQAES